MAKTTKATKVTEVKTNCPACRFEFEADEQIPNAKIAELKKSYLCGVHGEQWEAAVADEAATAAAPININAEVPKTANTTKKENTMNATKATAAKATKTTKAAAAKVAPKAAAKKAAAPKKTAAKAAPKKAATKVAAKTVAAKKTTTKVSKAILAPKTPKAKQERALGVQQIRVAEVAEKAVKLLGKQEAVKFTDMRPLVGKEVHDKMLRRALRIAARKGLLKKVSSGTYALAQ